MTYNTRKIVTLLTVLIVGAMISGCINSETPETQILVDNVDIVSSQNSEVTSELAAKNTATPIRKKHVSISVLQSSDSLLISINGGEDHQQLTDLRVIVNNETLTTYTPIHHNIETVECRIIGEWNIMCEGTFSDGTVQTLIKTRFSGLSSLPTKQIVTPTATVTTTPVPIAPTPTLTQKPVVKNAEPERPATIELGYFIGKARPHGGITYNDYIPLIIYTDVYRDVEALAKYEAEHPEYKGTPRVIYRVDPDIESYDVYINGELRESYTVKIEDFDGHSSLLLRPTVTEKDYPVTVEIVVEYIDGESFTVWERSQDSYPEHK